MPKVLKKNVHEKKTIPLKNTDYDHCQYKIAYKLNIMYLNDFVFNVDIHILKSSAFLWIHYIFNIPIEKLYII